MSTRSVIETLDLHDDYGKYHTEACATPNCGWLSPRISFSTDFINGASDKLSPDKQKNDESYSADFEFSMSPFDILDSNTTPPHIVPADELFHKGKLLPGFLPPCSTIKDTVTAERSALLERVDSVPALKVPSGHLNTTEIASALAPLGCVLGPSCSRASKGPKWRELFGALRRVKSDSGRQRIPDESFLPPKSMHGRKKFFKHFFSTVHNGTHDPKFTSTSSDATGSTSSATTISFSVSGVQEKNSRGDFLSRTVSSERFPGASSSRSASVIADSKCKAAYTSPDPYSTQTLPRSRGRTFEQRSDDFTFHPLPGTVSSTARISTSSTSIGRASPIKVPINRGANLMRSGSGRVIVRGLDRVSSGRNSALQEQLRALRAREIRRSPERSGYSNVRVTPVLNVPVCMGPVLRGATKVGKGRLSNFRSFLTFKSKLPTSLAAPIATR